MNISAVEPLAAALRAQVGVDAFYIFWFASGGGGASGAPPRDRILIAFPTPDAALAFAQRSVRRDTEDRPRLRRLTIAQLLLAVLRDPAIAALILVAESAGAPSAGQIPAGLRLERAELLARLEERPSAG